MCASCHGVDTPHKDDFQVGTCSPQAAEIPQPSGAGSGSLQLLGMSDEFSISVGMMLSQQKFPSVQAQHLSSLTVGLNEHLTCSCLEKNCSVQ